MVDDNNRQDVALELNGVTPDLVVNEELPQGIQETVAEFEREYLETERERGEWERELEPARRTDPDLLEQQERLLEELDEQLAAEFGVEDTYEELQDVERRLAEQRKEEDKAR